MSNNKKPHGFCETPHEKCTMSYCDENGCLNRNRQLISDDDLEFLRKQLKNIEYYKLGYNAAQKTLFTEEEIIRASEAGFDDGNGFVEEMKYNTAEQYYNETFGNEQQ